MSAASAGLARWVEARLQRAADVFGLRVAADRHEPDPGGVLAPDGPGEVITGVLRQTQITQHDIGLA